MSGNLGVGMGFTSPDFALRSCPSGVRSASPYRLPPPPMPQEQQRGPQQQEHQARLLNRRQTGCRPLRTARPPLDMYYLARNSRRRLVWLRAPAARR